MPKFAEVALDIPVYSMFTYSLPGELEKLAEPGKRIVVPFGKRTVTGIIVKLSDTSSLGNILPARFIADKAPVLNDELLKFCSWISDYYIAPPGEVFFSSVPRKSSLSSGARYRLHYDWEKKLESSGLRSRVYDEIISALRSSPEKGLTPRQIERRTGLNGIHSYLSKLILKQVAESFTSAVLNVHEKNVTVISRGNKFDDYASLLEASKLRSPKYKALIEKISEASEIESSALSNSTGAGKSHITKLVDLEILSARESRVMREHEVELDEVKKDITLNSYQKAALDEISASIDENCFKAFLLHGVTGSGKTEIYIRCAEICLSQGKSSIILVPEISLTPQLIHRFRTVFGKSVGAIHSRISEGERLDTFDRILRGEIRIVIGARSALFSPLTNIGMIVIDEEHDSSYKQDSSPRYSGRDAAVYRASLNGAVVILGSATPSVESFYNAQTGKYKLLTLPERVSESNLPDIRIVDLSDRNSFEAEEKDIFDSIMKTRVKFFSKELIYEIGVRLSRKQGVIILQNRRGYYSYLECRVCSNVEMCERCNIALAYHKIRGKMLCHYCGYSRDYSDYCTKCGSNAITPKGAGTERVEEELQKLFPSAAIVRLDSDSVSSRRKFEQTLNDFYNGKVDILTGTQIISKGLDFPNVTLVGVVNADIGLLNPDFRATEKTFQILTQVSGRSGRSSQKGEVLIQTNHSDYFVFDAVKNHDYAGLYEREVKLRKDLMYPPFSRIAVAEIKSADKKLAAESSRVLWEFLQKSDEKKLLEIFHPVPPVFSKLKDKYRYHIIIKSPKTADPAGSYLASVLRKARGFATGSFKSKTMLSIDMDAVNFM